MIPFFYNACGGVTCRRIVCLTLAAVFALSLLQLSIAPRSFLLFDEDNPAAVSQSPKETSLDLEIKSLRNHGADSTVASQTPNSISGIESDDSSQHLSHQEHGQARVTLPQMADPILNIEINSLQHHPHPDEDMVFSSYRKNDRSGAFVQDMLFAHAFAFQKNITYGGTCIDGDDSKIKKKKKALKHSVSHQRVIHALGLQDVLLPFYRCPGNQSHRTILKYAEYSMNDTAIWTPEWLAHIKSKMHYPSKAAETTKTERNHKPNDMLNVAIHIRRGDINPCTKFGYRYLPNSHYKMVMDYFLLPQKNTNNETKGYNITIFSESEAFEDWNYFENITNTTLRLDTDIADAWKTMMAADILITSKSSFSIVPAVFNQGTVIYTPFWHKPLKRWTQVPESILSQTAKEVRRLTENFCPRAPEQSQLDVINSSSLLEV